MKKSANVKKLWRYFITCIIVGFGITIPIELSIAYIANYFFEAKINILNLTMMVVISVGVGAFVMAIISKRLITPLVNLSTAMSKVAEGDFETKIKTKSNLKFIQNIYTNFNTMVKELAATETLQSDFVSNVSHEIKTPVGVIEGYATLLQACTENETEAEYVNKILFNTKRLSELVGNILLLSKVDNKAINAQKSTYRLDEQIRQSIVMLEPKWSAKNIEFDVDMEEIEYTGDKGLMFHVWNNLIDNAIKFNPINGSVKIKLKKQKDKIVFSVEDEGCGISDEEKKHIFNKFYQSDSSHKSEGNGLGLSLVKNILNICGGWIFVKDCENGGAEFTVTL